MMRAELLRRPTLVDPPAAAPVLRAPERRQQFFTVLVGQERFGLAISSVQTVFRAQDVVPAPLAPPWVRGLINLRGHIVTAIALGARLGLDLETNANAERNLAGQLAVGVESGGETFALLVDGVGDVAEIGMEDSIAIPAGLSSTARRMIACLYLTPAGLLPIIDLEAVVFHAPERRSETQSHS